MVRSAIEILNHENSNIIKGFLRSDKVVRYISDIPCDVINTLESDANEAEKFIHQLENGEVPTLIQNLPQEAIETFKDTIGIFLTLPSQIISAAEAGITDAAKIFNDIGSGAIVSDIENLPGVIVSDVTNAWGDLTSGLEDDWNAATHAIACFFVDCPISTIPAGSCSGNTVQPTTTTQPTSAGLPSSQRTTPTQTKPPTRTSTLSSTTGSSTAGTTQILTRSSLFYFIWVVGSGLIGVVLVL